MSTYHLSIDVKLVDRGNASGYTAYDYARDAAVEIERLAGDRFTWFDDKNEGLARTGAISFAEEQINEVREHWIGGDLLSFSIVKESIEDEDEDD